jgi:hypothetical protein
MASSKNTPNLPGSSRMQMPSGNGPAPKKLGGSKKVTNKVMAAAKGTGMKGKNPYC